MKKVIVDKGVSFGGGGLAFIAGPCVIESREMALDLAKRLTALSRRLKVPYVFKASFDKANRTSVDSYRGPGLEKGLEILAEIRAKFDVPVLTDIHEPWQAKPVAEVCDILQIPAFLARQTDLVVAAGETGAVVNVKKGQFMAPEDMKNVIGKMEEAGNPNLALTERGASFGYHNLVVDMRSFPIMRQFGYPVIFDATHSVQLPGGMGNTTGGQREFIPYLARAAAASGVDGFFMEVHDNPPEGLSDSTNMLYLSSLEGLLKDLIAINDVVKKDKEMGLVAGK